MFRREKTGDRLLLALAAIGLLGWVGGEHVVAWAQVMPREHNVGRYSQSRHLIRTGHGIYCENGYLIFAISWAADYGGYPPWAGPDFTWTQRVHFGTKRIPRISRDHELREQARMGNGFARLGIVAAWQRIGVHTYFDRGVAIRWWWLMVPMGLVVGMRAMRRLRDWRAAGRCAKCGYDLRATPERCPECGTAVNGM